MEPLTLPGTLDSLPAIGKYVLAAAAAAQLDKKAAYRLRLAVDEIATNVIIHGYEEVNRSGLLDIQAIINEAELTIFLEDTGATYQPDEVSQPTHLDQPLDERPLGGLGMYLAIHGVDQLRYEHIDNRNRHIFVVYRRREG
jgi:anti-sigma regulatory factor (Ser/Thr protein kinase)